MFYYLLAVSSETDYTNTSQWHHNGRDGVANHQPRDCLLNHLFRRKSKKTWNLRVTGLCAGNSPMTGDADNVSISRCHHESDVIMNQIRHSSCFKKDMLLTMHSKYSRIHKFRHAHHFDVGKMHTCDQSLTNRFVQFYRISHAVHSTPSWTRSEGLWKDPVFPFTAGW